MYTQQDLGLMLVRIASGGSVSLQRRPRLLPGPKPGLDASRGGLMFDIAWVRLAALLGALAAAPALAAPAQGAEPAPQRGIDRPGFRPAHLQERWPRCFRAGSSLPCSRATELDTQLVRGAGAGTGVPRRVASLIGRVLRRRGLLPPVQAGQRHPHAGRGRLLDQYPASISPEEQTGTEKAPVGGGLLSRGG
ncbi:hypothetical protein CDD83_2421 [Cordyceps sp. RAO-2017]|nr:hypothetical protein CDD83_2421 [Cordyceps sp. RAO-2017]